MPQSKSVDLTGKVAIITGGARGIGEATARAMCEAGASVIVADVLVDAGEETARQLRAAGYQARCLLLDVRDDGSWAKLIEETLATFGKIDILINNAGVTSAQTIEDATIDDFQAMFDINLFGVVRGIKACIPEMKAAGGGAIVNISSNSTQKLSALTSAYSASKAAVANITKTTAIHLAETGTGIRVNSVHPGPSATPMLLGDDGRADIPIVRQLINSIPMGRMAEPAEIAAVITFLASDAASYVTAAELFVDGGLTPNF